jgi:TNF receptor-associated protein 1
MFLPYLGVHPNPNPNSKDEDSSEAEKDEKDKKEISKSSKLSEAEAVVLCDWMKNTLGPQRVRDVKTTTRLHGSPAIITDHESGALRRMMKMLVSISV